MNAQEQIGVATLLVLVALAVGGVASVVVYGVPIGSASFYTFSAAIAVLLANGIVNLHISKQRERGVNER